MWLHCATCSIPATILDRAKISHHRHWSQCSKRPLWDKSCYALALWGKLNLPIKATSLWPCCWSSATFYKGKVLLRAWDLNPRLSICVFHYNHNDSNNDDNDNDIMSSLLYTIMAILSAPLLKYMNTNANVHVALVRNSDDWWLTIDFTPYSQGLRKYNA